jgi:hypothetical protein
MNVTRFKPLKIWLFLLLLLAVPVLLAAEDQSRPMPVAVVPEAVYEFPATPEGEYVVHDFVVQNQGDGVLNVLRVKTT